MRNTLRVDKNTVREDALFDIYRVMRPGEPPTVEAAEAMFKSLFFDGERYDLSSVGRVKMNMRLELDCPDDVRVIRKEDVLAVLRTLVGLRDGQRRDRRHRQPRQPPGPLGGRTAGEPVPRRPAAHGARDQGAHELGRHRHGHAARPDQCEAGGRGRAGVLRLLAALAVHGPDQPAVGDHPQAPPVGAWPGRSDPRAGGLRSPRRAPDPLRPDLPDRDAGRPEHRPDQLAGHPRGGEQVRLHREPVPADQGRQDHRRGRLHVGHGRGEARHRPGQHQARERRRSSRTWSPAGSTASRRLLPRDQRRPDGRVAEAGGLGRRLADPVPRERRRQPRPDGLEHAEAGRAAHPVGCAAGRHRHGEHRGRGLRRRRGRPAAPASSSRSTAPGSWSARRKRPTPPSRASTSTGCRSSSAPTPRPASTSVRWCGWATRSWPATSSPTARRPSWANWRWAATPSSPSCPGMATTSKTRS